MNDQLQIYDEGQKKMSVYEIASALCVSESTILRYIKKVFPDRLKSGVKTWLTEEEATAMKLKLQQNQHLVRSEELPKTDLEKELLIQQAMQFQAEKIQKLQKQLEEARPKIEFHNRVIDSTGLLTLSETAKILKTGRTRFCNWLREKGIFQKGRAIPYQEYENSEYFEVKVTTSNNHIQKQTFVTPKGLQWLECKFKNGADENKKSKSNGKSWNQRLRNI